MDICKVSAECEKVRPLEGRLGESTVLYQHRNAPWFLGMLLFSVYTLEVGLYSRIDFPVIANIDLTRE